MFITFFKIGKLSCFFYVYLSFLIVVKVKFKILLCNTKKYIIVNEFGI